MSRLGDLIRTERIRQKMTPKQVAKKCGVSESYLMAVEAGTRIIADDQARRILKAIGLKQQNEAEFTLDDIAATVDLAQVQPKLAEALKKKPEHKEAEKVRIEGANPDKVFFYLAPDDSMRGFRIHRGDIVLTVPANSPVDGAVMLLNYNEHRYLRKIKVLDDRTVMLQHYDREYEAETVPISEIGFLSRCVQVTFELQ